jgi:IPT/TIG domain-containing protein
MQLVDLNKPGEKKKLISAGVLGLAAIVTLYWVFIGFDSGTPKATRPQPTPTPQQRAAQTTQRPNGPGVSQEVMNAAVFTEVHYDPSSYNAPEAKRNIFAYYEPPKPVVAPPTPSPTPEPSPPGVLLASVSPSNVYARTADFKLEVAGDKFTPAMRIYVDGRELPTTYKNPQQVSTTIPASFIANPGARNVVVRTPDNQLFSNQATINVAAPPTPNFSYIGIISPENRVADTAVVQDKSNKNVLSVYKGDVIGGRFRVTSISDKELVLTDTTLKIKHTLAMTEGDKSAGALSRPTPRVDAEDDEP